VFTIPPSSVPSIGDDMIANHVSWKYYGDQWNNYVPDPYQLNYNAIGKDTDEYCNICNPFQYDTSIMANAAVRTAHIQDTANLYSDIKDGTLPAVSIVKPSGLVDGHPSSSKLDLFEGFTKKIIDAVQANPALWKDTAIFITEDEGGGYYDSGYVQPLDYFGDGTRIPLIVVSPYTKAGHISHDYADHVSILKFIEANWGFRRSPSRSRDNFPNPIATADNPYVPTNSPAIDDLMSLFNFRSKHPCYKSAGVGLPTPAFSFVRMLIGFRHPATASSDYAQIGGTGLPAPALFFDMTVRIPTFSGNRWGQLGACRSG
jgi:phospholipase C